MRAEVGQSFDAREIKTQSRRANLHTDSRFALRLSSQRPATRSRVHASVHFSGKAELFVESHDAGKAVGQNVVLGKEGRRRRQDSDSQIAEGIDARVLAELFAEQHLAVGVRLIQANSARLVRVGQLHAKTKSHRRQMRRFVAQLDLGPEHEVANVVCRVRIGGETQRNCARAASVDAQNILRHAFNLDFDVWGQANTDADYARARQIAGQSRNGKPRLLHKINCRRDTQGARRNDVDVFSD